MLEAGRSRPTTVCDRQPPNVGTLPEPRLGEAEGTPVTPESCPSGCGIEQVEKLNFLFGRQKRSFKRIARQLAQVFVGKAESFLHQSKFLDQRSSKHRGIV